MKILEQVKKLDFSAVKRQYNLFCALQIATDEVRLHSRFIGDLLSVSGNHGVGSKFLLLFLEAVNATDLFPNINSVQVHVERHIGAVTEASGGQLDIVLLDNQNNCLIIENKIYAGDQKNQMLRYLNFAKQQEFHGGHFKIFYLTLHGNKASDDSVGNQKEHGFYTCISYQSTIRLWLESCRTQVRDKQCLFDSINMYLHLIEELTKMENEQEQQAVINEINASVDNFKAAELLSKALLPAKCALLKDSISRVVAKLKHEFTECLFIIDPNFGYQYKGLEIHLKKNREAQNHIRFSFLSDARDCYIEIHPGYEGNIIKNKDTIKRDFYQQELNSFFPNNIGKVLNTERYWQGEWVMHYYYFNDKFFEILEHKPDFTDKVCSDLKKILQTFIRAENESFI